MKEFELEVFASKKRTKMIKVVQLPHVCKNGNKYEKRDFVAVPYRQKYGELKKIRSQYQRNKLQKYLDMTIGEVYEIAEKDQDWELLIVTPVVTIIKNSLVLQSVFGNKEKIDHFLKNNNTGTVYLRFDFEGVDTINSLNWNGIKNKF